MNESDNDTIIGVTEQVTHTLLDSGIGIVFIVDLILFLFFFLLWNYFLVPRPKQTLFDEDTSTTQFETEQNDEPIEQNWIHRKLQNTSFSWLAELTSFTKTDIINRAGFDAYIFLRLQTFLAFFFLVSTIIGVGVLVPINVVEGRPNNNFEFFSTTTGNIHEHSPFFWVHVAFTGLVSTMAILIYIWLGRVSPYKNNLGEGVIDVRDFTVMIQRLPETFIGPKDEARLHRYLEQIYPGLVFNVSLVGNVATLRKIQDLLEDAAEDELALEHYLGELARTRKRPTISGGMFSELGRLIPFSSRYEDLRVDAIEFYAQKLGEAKKELDGLRTEVRCGSGPGIGFVIFKSSASACRFLNEQRNGDVADSFRSIDTSEAERLRVEEWVVERAPNPNDIFWMGLSIPRATKIWRAIAANVVLTAVLICLVTPVSIAAGLFSFPQLWPDKITVAPLWFEAIFVSYLPSLAHMALVFVFPFLVQRLTGWEGHNTQQKLDRSILAKVSRYLLLGTLFLPVLLLTTFDSISELQQSFNNTKLSMFEKMKPFSPNWGFFVNFVIQTTFLGGILQLLRPRERMVAFWRTIKGQFKRPPHFLWGHRYSRLLLMFSIGLFFSTIVPLILPVTLLYFTLQLTIDRYYLAVEMLYTCADFRTMKTVRRTIGWTVVFYLLGVIAFLAFLKDSFEQSAACGAMLIVIIIIFVADRAGCWPFHHSQELEKGGWASDHHDAENSFRPKHRSEDFLVAFRDAYRHPAFK
eukprot:TRINITY_DN5868_c0_g1_i1.p1 TRINITY_DN5868_c0_g1~~TRINITY_DN5868_c0_g1_i1.p1  ORF type:complete len:749 (+),score=110.58 TRINITY_DN5868_c0_g1_i1:186-2432(+)